MSESKAVHRKSPSFDYLFTNTFGLSGGDNHVTISFGFEEPNFENDEKRVLDLVGMTMTPRGLKTLWLVMGQLVEQLEKEHGEIKVSDTLKIESSNDG